MEGESKVLTLHVPRHPTTHTPNQPTSYFTSAFTFPHKDVSSNLQLTVA